ncbi:MULTISPECIES: helix-turn-helix transcriptional regulator [unclassified Rhizobium]|uniref:helix-turn-helix transcriptional regulator n=1 Tax=Rhizobium sp. BG4 TaxID=2613770 RepID=UPI00193E64E6|nr:AraC family transcriptional regulator [Rhizobium sp. BG4]QRM47382.1 helix-turn-helix transcriptional regulator [Rhizobium sp. BG4]
MSDAVVIVPSKTADVGRLLKLARQDTRIAVEGESHPPVISAFVTRVRETLNRLVMPTAGLVVLLEGTKDIVSGTEHRIYRSGDAFILNANEHVDVVNEPDHKSGFYRALFVRFDRALIKEAARLWPQFVNQELRLREPLLTDDLCSALLHAAEALSYQTRVSRRVAEHRLLEVLLILAEQGAISLTPKYVDGSVVEAVRLLVRHRLHFPWTTAAVSSEFSMSEATLRRRLSAEGHSLEHLLLDERMKAAFTILNDRDASVAEALAATGYQSRSHFSKHFQQRFGATPSEVRLHRSQTRLPD